MRPSVEGLQESAQKFFQVIEDQAQVVGGAAQQGVDGVADDAFEIVALQPAIGLHVADDGLDRAAPAELAFDGWGDPATPAGGEAI